MRGRLSWAKQRGGHTRETQARKRAQRLWSPIITDFLKEAAISRVHLIQGTLQVGDIAPVKDSQTVPVRALHYGAYRSTDSAEPPHCFQILLATMLAPDWPRRGQQ